MRARAFGDQLSCVSLTERKREASDWKRSGKTFSFFADVCWLIFATNSFWLFDRNNKQWIIDWTMNNSMKNGCAVKNKFSRVILSCCSQLTMHRISFVAPRTTYRFGITESIVDAGSECICADTRLFHFSFDELVNFWWSDISDQRFSSIRATMALTAC